MTDLIWAFIFCQTMMGGFDSLYHHELTQRLAWRPSQRVELGLHGVRNLSYALIFGALGWSELHGAWAMALIALIAAEVVVTLWDFVEEDRSRRLPHTERVLHGILTANYGAVLVLLVPVLLDWAARPTVVQPAYYWPWSWFCAIAAVGTIASGLRELVAARRATRIVPAAAAPLATALTRRQSVLVTGGTGFVGSRLVEALVAAGHDVAVLTRDRAHAAALPAPLRIVTSLEQIAGNTRLDAIVNLAGEPISDGLWTDAKRQRIVESRVEMTRGVLALIERLQAPPDVLVSGSAVGWYGLRGDEALDETSVGTDCFSRQVCVAWEREAAAATERGVRVVSLRTGLVLAAEGGMLSRLLVPFELGMGGRLGAGRHWMSWIHRDDMVRLIVHAIATPTLAGPLNATAPVPVRNADFTSALGRALARPALLPVPAPPLRLALGAFADELLLGGQKVMPRAALGSGFEFAYPTIDVALGAIVGRQSAASLPMKWSTPSLRSPFR